MVYNDESDHKPSNGTMIVVNTETSEGETTSQEDVTLGTILNRLIGDVLYPDPSLREYSLPRRVKASVSGNIPLLRDSMKNSGQRILDWTRQGSPLRALLVVSLGTISLISLTGWLVFMLFFITATVNAIIISLVISLAAAGGFLAVFFTCVAAIYIGALSIALFIISTITTLAIGLVLIATGWIGFFFTVWLIAKKSIDLAKHSIFTTGSALSAYSLARRESKKSD